MEVSCLDIDDAVLINFEINPNLRDTLRLRFFKHKVELANESVLSHNLAFALVHFDLHHLLVVLNSGENLAFLHRQRRIPVDNRHERLVRSFDPEAHRSDVEQQEVRLLAHDLELRRGSLRDAGVRVELRGGIQLQQLRNVFAHRRLLRLAANEQHSVQLVRLNVGVVQRLNDGRFQLLVERLDQIFVVQPADELVAVLRGKRLLDALGCLLVQLQLFLQKRCVIVAAKIVVPRTAQHLVDFARALHHRHVARAGPQVHDQEKLRGLCRGLLKIIRERCRSRFRNQPHNLNSRFLRCALCEQFLICSVIGRNSDHCSVYFRVMRRQLLQKICGDVLDVERSLIAELNHREVR